MRDERDYSLLSHNTFGIDARCRRYVEYASVDEAQMVASMLREAGCPFLIIGAGSNLLLTKDFEGIVVRSSLRGISLMEHNGEALLRCGSGETWDDVVAWTVERGFADMVNLSLIPGDVGASAVQNIGAYGSEVCQLIEEVHAVEIATGQRQIIKAQECRYAYRDSRFKHEWSKQWLITHVVYRLSRSTQPNIEYGNIRAELERRGTAYPTPQQLREVIIDIRRSKLPDPMQLGNAGSFFTNPIVSRDKYEQLAADCPQMPHYYIDEEHEKIPAGWMIEQCGWKGRSLGRAAVHDKQALVLVNLGGASGQDIVDLCDAIRRDVAHQFGIDLIPEVNIV